MMSRHYLHSARSGLAGTLAILAGGLLLLVLIHPCPASAAGKGDPDLPLYPPSALLGAPKGAALSSGEVFDYFREVALNVEITSSRQGIVRKWMDGAGVEIQGDTTLEDRRTIREVMEELNRLTGKSFQMEMVQSGGQIRIHFGNMSTFLSIEPNYVPGNTGFVWVRWQENAIYDANLLVDTSQTSQAQRNHYIREELTQALGMLGDSLLYPESIFYDRYTETDAYTDIDRAVIRMLYDPRVLPGMNGDEVSAALHL